MRVRMRKQETTYADETAPNDAIATKDAATLKDTMMSNSSYCGDFLELIAAALWSLLLIAVVLVVVKI
jgi:hypothetical protein